MKSPLPSLFDKFGKQSLVLQQNAPTILFTAGVVGVIGSTVLACKATLKLEETLEVAQTNLATAKRLSEERDEYTDDDRRRDTAIIYLRSVGALTKLYGPSVVLGGVSIYALTSSHSMLMQRNASLMAAYTVLDKGFTAYRERVVEKYGEEQDDEFRYGTQPVKVKDETTGRQKTVQRVGPQGASIYAMFFDELNPNWERRSEYNLMFLKCQQNYANDKLRARGFMFLNEVYDMLGMAQTSAGAVVGWIIDKDISDNYIDFGIFRGETQEARDFVNGAEGAILLDFNVDGVIYDKIEEITQ